MTTIDTNAYPSEPRLGINIIATIHDAFAEAVRRHRHRQVMAEIARFDPHLICDIGLDPERVKAAKGAWDQTLGRWPDWHPVLPHEPHR